MMSVAIRTAEPEMEGRAYRRRFSTADQLRIWAEADACTEPGALGAWLRREGCYSSHLATWRAQAGGRRPRGLGQPRGRKPHRPWSAKMPGSVKSGPACRMTWPKPAR